MTTIIAIETATDACSCAVWHDGEIHQEYEIAPRRHAELVLPMIDALLNQQHLQRSDIDAIAVGQGPGSFMGTRLASSIAIGSNVTVIVAACMLIRMLISMTSCASIGNSTVVATRTIVPTIVTRSFLISVS